MILQGCAIPTHLSCTVYCSYPIVGTSDTKYLVLFVDYGVVDEVLQLRIFHLPMEFCKLSSQALKLRITGNSSCEALVGSIVCLNIQCCDPPIETAFKLPEVSEKSGGSDSVTVALRLMPLETEFPFKAVMAHVENVTNFYLHKLDKDIAENMEDLEYRMHNFYTNEANHNAIKGQAGNAACVYSLVCRQFCRVTVVESCTDRYVVQLVDYGHFENVASQDLLELALEFFCYPMFTIHCQLVLFDEVSSIEECTRLFKELLASIKVLKVVKG